MGSRTTGGQYRYGLIVLLDGVSLWFLAVLTTAYLSGADLPWQSVTEFLVSFHTYTGTWISAPHVGLPAVIGYLGIALTVVGPSWYWVRPWLARVWRIMPPVIPVGAFLVGIGVLVFLVPGVVDDPPQLPPPVMTIAEVGSEVAEFVDAPLHIIPPVMPVVEAVSGVAEFSADPLRFSSPDMMLVGGVFGSFVLFFGSIYLLSRVTG